MKSKSSLKRLFATAGLAGALAVSAAVAGAAQDLPKEGKFAFRSCWSGTSKAIALSKTYVAYTLNFRGTVLTDKPGGLFDHNTFHCVGMAATLADKKEGHIVCEAIDPDGDKRMSRYTLGIDGNYHSEVVTGTGKYEGMMITHTNVKQLGQFPTIEPGTFQACNHQTGTYKLK
jgi:hypothetical protein